MTATAAAAASPIGVPVPASHLASITRHPYVGLAGVLLGAVISTLTTRLTTFGLADIRGALDVGFDEGAWINTAFTVAQMLIGPIAVWVSFVIGIRRVLLTTIPIFCVAELLLPLAQTLPRFLSLQVMAGLTSGTFIPLTIGFVLRSLPPRFWAIGVTLYAMNLELSLNIGATLEGWYAEHHSWHWIFWQNTLLSLPMLACIWRAVPREAFRREELGKGDYLGMLCAGVGFAILYAALDQGDRLDWLNSDLITVMALTGIVLVAAFFAREGWCRRPGIDLSFLAGRNILWVLLLVVLVRFLILAVSFLVPQYLAQIKGLRPLQVGDVLLWIALPQFLLAPLVATYLIRYDARRLMLLGFGLLTLAFWQASSITSAWAETDFLVSQLLQAVGQSCALTAVIYFFARHIQPAYLLSFGAVIQTVRLFGGQMGAACVQVMTRKGEQIHSQLLGLHVGAGDPLVLDRLAAYAAGLASQATAVGSADAQSVSLLDRALRAQAYVLAYADGFRIAAMFSLVGIAIVLILKPAPPLPRPAPASPVSAPSPGRSQ